MEAMFLRADYAPSGSAHSHHTGPGGNGYPRGGP